MALVLTEHQLVPTEVIVDELREVVGRAAVAGDVDVIGTGDKAFLSLALEQPRTMTARAFLDAYYGTG